jgi:hypothetical protein
MEGKGCQSLATRAGSSAVLSARPACLRARARRTPSRQRLTARCSARAGGACRGVCVVMPATGDEGFTWRQHAYVDKLVQVPHLLGFVPPSNALGVLGVAMPSAHDAPTRAP